MYRTPRHMVYWYPVYPGISVKSTQPENLVSKPNRPENIIVNTLAISATIPPPPPPPLQQWAANKDIDNAEVSPPQKETAPRGHYCVVTVPTTTKLLTL